MKLAYRFVGPIIALVGLAFSSAETFAFNDYPTAFDYEGNFVAEENEDTEEIKFRLVTIVSEPEDNLVHQVDLFANLNNEIVALTRESVEDAQTILPEDLFDHEILLAKSGKYDAVFLGSVDCNTETGGEIYIRYLHNGAMMKYRKFFMKLRYNGSNWNLYTDEGERIETLTLRKRTILGALIGIDKIEVNTYR